MVTAQVLPPELSRPENDHNQKEEEEVVVVETSAGAPPPPSPPPPPVEEKKELVIIEDDWSSFMTSNGGFARHEELEEIVLENGVCLKIASTSSLSPLDMIDLSWGTNDATGHCIWTGARFFLQVLPQLSEWFVNRRVLELGSGTGLSGIAVALLNVTKELVLTDSSESVLELCKQNCELNNLSEPQVKVKELFWGTRLLETSSQSQSSQSSSSSSVSSSELFDTVFATDVLYDIGSWLPLLRTVIMSMSSGGTFILSHLPRAALPDEESSSACSLEEYLIKSAKQEGLDVIKIIRPNDIHDNNNNNDKFNEMDEKGAAIFQFQKI